MDDDDVFDSLPWPAIDPPDVSERVQMADDLVVLYHRQYAEKLYRSIRSSFRSKVDAEEITQETFFRLHKVLCRGKEIRRPESWLMIVGRNLAMNRARGRVRELAKLEKHARLRPDDRAPSAEDALLEQSLLEQVREALLALPAIERDCLLARCQGLTLREIGALIGKDLRRVPRVLQRALKRMRNLIE
jgi:RNA polymerase sigma-70 factor (ECF subfamily)